MRAYLAAVLETIEDEAAKTKPPGMTMSEAVSILIDERVERGILSLAEAAEIRGGP